MVRQFDEKTDHRLLYRRLGVCAVDVLEGIGMYQMNMFVDYEALDRDRKLTAAMLEVRRKYGANAVFKGMNMLEGATTLERNMQIGGHSTTGLITFESGIRRWMSEKEPRSLLLLMLFGDSTLQS